MDTEVRATTRVERGQEQARRPEQNKNEKEDRQRERAGTHFQFSPSGASCRRSLALLASFAHFFFSFFWKKKKPARHVLLRRAFIEALAAWRRLVRFDGIGPWQRERRKEKEEERERKNSKACSCFFFAPVKKGGGAPLLLSILPRSPPLAPGASESTHTRPDGVGLAKKSLCVCHELSERGRQKIVFFSSHRLPFSPHSRQLKQQASRPRQEAQQGQDHERQRGGDLVGERAREREKERDK